MAVVNFKPILDMLDRAIRLDEGKAWIYAIDKETQGHIIQMNTKDQLEEQGIFSDGTPTGEYSFVTVGYKIQKGDRYDHMTFKDTGGFYDSFRVDVDKNGLVIDADGQVSADTNLFKVYGEDIAGLTDENVKFLIEIVAEKYIEYVKRELLS